MTPGGLTFQAPSHSGPAPTHRCEASAMPDGRHRRTASPPRAPVIRGWRSGTMRLGPPPGECALRTRLEATASRPALVTLANAPRPGRDIPYEYHPRIIVK